MAERHEMKKTSRLLDGAKRMALMIVLAAQFGEGVRLVGERRLLRQQLYIISYFIYCSTS